MPIRYLSGVNVDSNTLVVDAANDRVGIGTTAPVTKLHVYSGNSGATYYHEGIVVESNGRAALNILSGAANDGYVFFGNSTAGNAGYIGYENTNNNLVLRSSDYISLLDSTGTVVRIDGGNVGIGTTAPVTSLHVVGTSYVNGDLRIGSSFNATNQTSILKNQGAAGLGIFTWGDTAPVVIGGGHVIIRSEAGANRNLYVTGNVGIGTTSPTNQLTVTTATNAVDVVRLNNTGGDSGSVQGVTHLAINHFNSGTNPSTRITAYQDGVSGWPGGMYFSTRSLNTDSAPVERMRITSAGNVGIGTSSPNASYRATITTAVGQTGALQTTGSVNINSGALAVGSITPSGTAGRIDASNDIVAFSTSDRRFKENITPIANALDKVKTLTGVEFDWKQETKDYHGYEGHDVGVIAQDVQAVLPEAVRTNDSGYLSVRYEKMIALLVEAMKEQQAQIEELKKLIK